jgi:aspartyl-tRNA synthetase
MPYRTHTCGELSLKNLNEKITLSGWVQSRRDHGGIIFIDLRDHYGITQIKINPNKKDAFQIADSLRSEYVIQITGIVKARPQTMINSKLKTGEIELEVSSILVLNKALTPPFEIDKDKKVDEEVRLKYRYLDLRRDSLHKKIETRYKLIKFVRNFLEKQNFIEIQTPIMTSSSPEGARDFLVPSRLHPGKFYALPQAPQQFKQLLMNSGFDRYYQIAPCFRDEDPRADRSPCEFYQIDLEMAFAEQEDVLKVCESMLLEITQKFTNKKILKKPFPRLTYQEALLKYGSDKPDLRYDLTIEDVSDVFHATNFKIFKEALEKKGVIRCLKVPHGAKLSRKDIEELTQLAQKEGAGGLAYITFTPKPKSPILKFLTNLELNRLIKLIKPKEGDLLFFGASHDQNIVAKALGAVRKASATKFNLQDPHLIAWAWIVDFPMYQFDSLENRIDFMHNPFSLPQGGLKALQEKNPLSILAYQYDVVANGYEIGSGAIRNHDSASLYKAFEIAGYSQKDIDEKFSGFIESFKYGAPPHGGIAPGIDRLLMLLTDTENIREVIPFPKNGNAQDLMLNAPSEINPKQLKEAHVKLDLDEK